MASTIRQLRFLRLVSRHLAILGVLSFLLYPNLVHSRQASAPVISSEVPALRVSADLNSLTGPLQSSGSDVPEGETLPRGVPAPPSVPIFDPVIQLREGYGAGDEGLSHPIV